MPFRSVVAEPEELKRLAGAFDAAWIAINSPRPIDPIAASAARERLGYIIVGLWKTDPHQDLAAAAVQQFIAAPGIISTATFNPAQPLNR
jgi:hypothetical protein